MADKFKDADELKLESLFRVERIADDGFSNRVVRRIRQKLWVRRTVLPVAAAIGASVAVKPLTGLVSALFRFVATLPVDMSLLTESLPPVHFIVSGAILLLGAVVGLRAATE